MACGFPGEHKHKQVRLYHDKETNKVWAKISPDAEWIDTDSAEFAEWHEKNRQS